jgi:predicted DNA-binding transcriptional regulator AlpA
MQNTNEIPRLLRWKEVSQIIPFSRSYVYDLMNQGKFPKGYKLVHGGQAVGWWASDINDYMLSLMEPTEDSESTLVKHMKNPYLTTDETL